MDIVVTGSLAFDRIMDFPGYFSEHILPEKIHVLNVSFTVNSMKEKFGGTAGNIAYALTMLGEQPLIMAAVGRDFQSYFEWLDKHGISRKGIKIIDDEFTACAYITTDNADNQITGFNPGAMKYPSSGNFDSLDPDDSLVIIAPGNLEDMAVYSRICQARGIDFIFDPGQSLPMWEGPDLVNCIEGSRILISNDYELELITGKTGLDRRTLLEKTKAIITTLGENGSTVYSGDREIEIPAAKPRKVLDPTGAGDAYRAGLISGLVKGKDVNECAIMGSACASFAVEEYGTQEYSFSLAEFNDRLKNM